MPLTTLSELSAASSVNGENMAVRSLARMNSASAPMPPSYSTQATPDDLQVFANWVDAGMPAGDCLSDAGNDFPVPDAGPKPTTCTSGSIQSTANRYAGSRDMNPGLACIACHSGQDFNGQNPYGYDAPRDVYTVMGTVFPGLNEQDFCRSSIPTGTVVQISDANGVLMKSITVRSQGNFYANITGGLKPYRAKVLSGGKVSAMMTLQANGDCNSCHTEQGTNGAPGRILLPH